MEKIKAFYRFGSIALRYPTQRFKLATSSYAGFQLQKRVLSPLNTTKIYYQFCQKQSKPTTKPETKIQTGIGSQKQQVKQTEENPKTTKQNGLEKLTSEQQFNLFVGLEKNHSFRNDLVVAHKRYNQEIKQLKQAILFEDLLKKQIDILIYDTQGQPFYQEVFKSFLRMVSVIGTIILFYYGLKTDKKFKVSIEKTAEGQLFTHIIGLMCFALFIITTIKHLRMCKRYVQKIVYHTEDETFTFVRRKAYGKKYEQKVSRFKILYTENPVLLKRGTNYLNIENQSQYRIGYTFAWKKEDLFSHLISQRIRT